MWFWLVGEKGVVGFLFCWRGLQTSQTKLTKPVGLLVFMSTSNKGRSCHLPMFRTQSAGATACLVRFDGGMRCGLDGVDARDNIRPGVAMRKDA